MDSSSSSKVTVEYHDPSGVFPLISNDLTHRLPLRNLNWQSQARPLRQIKHLHVELIPDRETQATLRPNAPQTESKRSSLDIIRNAGAARPDEKDRRHQIPGLKTTPYLKLYILRCDDKDWYKQEERAKVKEWLRNIAGTDGKQEQHEAFEWLIIHVVVPDTVAASEPRWRESSKDPDELKERAKNSNAKWPGKPVKTVFDRLRNDFNDSKSPDHVAQIRLSKSTISVDLLPVPALAKTLEETPDEREKSWNDLMTKIRSSILSSFDARVRQYEADVAEQEARRSMPGWNFCTFFIHKEGLARALESVGLVEDALAIYDELSLGLETILIDLASGQAAATATSFQNSGRDVIERITRPKQGTSSQYLFDKDYREEIVRSAVSVFDFFCYLFERQTALILRLAGKAARTESGLRDGEDLVMLAEVCWRGLSFIHNGARTLKQDLVAMKDLTMTDIQSLTSSWTFSVADFVLNRTQSTHLDISDAGLKSPVTPGTALPRSPGHAEFGFSMGADAYPQRTSSLPVRKPHADNRSTTTSSSAPKLSEDGFFSPPSSSGTDTVKPAEVPGLAELAAYRAELVSLKRKVLEYLASGRGWTAGWASLAEEKFEQIDLHHADDVESATRSAIEEKSAPSATLGADVAKLLRSRKAFEVAFELLTDMAARHYICATHVKFSERLMGDLAILKYDQGNFADAATYFEHVLPIFASDGWTMLEARAIALQSRCLFKLGRYQESVKTALLLLAKSAQKHLQDEHSISLKCLVDDIGPIQPWTEVHDLAKHLPEPLNTPMAEYFVDIMLNHTIEHVEGKEGFICHLSLRNLLDQAIELDSAEVKLAHISDPTVEVILQTTAPFRLDAGKAAIELRGTVTTFGTFHVQLIELKAGKITFVHDYAPKSSLSGLELDTAPDSEESHRPTLLLWPAQHAFDARLVLSQEVAVNRPQHFSLELASGQNEITGMEIRMKPATAGLRIYLIEAAAVGVEISPSQSQAGLLCLGSMSANSRASASIRYSTEQAATEIIVKLEILYTTTAGQFTFLQNVRLAAQLPLDVEVNDRFHNDAILSRFTISSTGTSPLYLDNAQLHESTIYAVEPPSQESAREIILSNQPADLLFKIKRKQTKEYASKASALELVLDCVSVDKLIVLAITTQLKTELNQSPHAQYERLVTALLSERFEKLFTSQDMELAALLGEVKVPSFAEFGWFDIIDALPEDLQRPLTNWLMRWHIDHQRIVMDVDVDAARKRVVIAVDVPTADVAFTTTLTLMHAQTLIPIVQVGQQIPMTLKLRFTRKWSSALQQVKASEGDFVYDVQAEPDIWLIDGRKRGRFAMAGEAGEFEASLALIPLQVGLQALPTIDVQPVREETQAPHLVKNITSQTYCESAGQVVQVIAGRQVTRIVVPEADTSIAA